MQTHLARLTVVAALVTMAPATESAVLAAEVATSQHTFSQLGLVSLGFEDMTLMRTVQTQTEQVRREATAEEKRAAIANGRAIYASFSPEKKAKLKRKKVRYIAVATTPTASVSTSPADRTPSGGLDLMVFDTSEGTVANKYVYTVKDKPEVGSSIKLDDYDTLFTGL